MAKRAKKRATEKTWRGLRGAIRIEIIDQIKTALVLTNGNVSRAARMLEIDRVTLHRQLVRYGLSDWSPKSDPAYAARVLSEMGAGDPERI